MNLYLIRHVHTYGNEGRFNGVSESEFTPKGLKMKEILVDYFSDLARRVKFDRIYTSPIKRAYLIAEDISLRNHIPLTCVDALKEYNFGIFDGLKIEEARKLDEKVYFEWLNNHLYYKIPKGESYLEKYQDSTNWIKEILKENLDNVLIVTHGAVIRCLISYLLDLRLKDGWHFDVPLGGFCLINYENNYGTLKEFGLPDYPFEIHDFSKSFIK